MKDKDNVMFVSVLAAIIYSRSNMVTVKQAVASAREIHAEAEATEPAEAEPDDKP